MIEDMAAPKRIFNLDPKAEKKAPPKEDTAEYWKQQAEAARHKREYLEENRMQESITSPPEPPESPFQVKGEFNLGKIDFQEQQRLATETAERARKEAAENVKEAEKQRDEARQALASGNLANMQRELGTKIEALQTAIADNNKGGIVEQLAGIEKIAGILGYQKPEVGPTDSTLTLEIKKLEWAMKKEDRDFQRLMKQDERHWQIELKKLEQSSREADAKLKQENEKYQALANIPERIGVAFAQGYKDRANGQQADFETQEQIQKETFHAEASEGEAGEIDCPQCQTAIGIGPTTRLAECAKCHTKVTVSRKTESVRV